MYDIQKGLAYNTKCTKQRQSWAPRRVLKIRDHTSSPPAHVSADPPSLTHLGCDIVGPDGTVSRKTRPELKRSGRDELSSHFSPATKGGAGATGRGRWPGRLERFNRLAAGSGWYPSMDWRCSEGGMAHQGAIRLGAGGSSVAAKQGGSGREALELSRRYTVLPIGLLLKIESGHG